MKDYQVRVIEEKKAMMNGVTCWADLPEHTMNQEKFETWALVELFGHQRIVGLVTEQAVGGASFIRVDVPDANGATRFTRLFGAAAIYAINPVEKSVAIALAQRCDARPVQAYDLPQLPARSDDDAEDDDGSHDGPCGFDGDPDQETDL